MGFGNPFRIGFFIRCNSDEGLRLRRQAKSFPAVYFESGTFALIKLAMASGMSCNLNVVELPIYLLDDVKINEDEWQLPEDKELEAFLDGEV